MGDRIVVAPVEQWIAVDPDAMEDCLRQRVLLGGKRSTVGVKCVEALGGTIKVESTVGKGSIFRVRLPESAALD